MPVEIVTEMRAHIERGMLAVAHARDLSSHAAAAFEDQLLQMQADAGSLDELLNSV